MYGIINQSISGLINRDFGAEKWDEIRRKANVSDEQFYNEVLYDDKLTYDLAIAASEVLGAPLFEVLRLFGNYWVLDVAAVKYKSLMGMGGSQLREFLMNLPKFHTRVMLIYPEVTPPEFLIESPEEDVFILHYYSVRPGLSGLMLGMVQGMVTHFGAKADIRILQTKADGLHDHDMFEIKIQE